MNDILILTPLEKALSSLNKALIAEKTELNRDAAIQRFEYSFELAWRLTKRYLTQFTGFKESSIKNVFREAAKQGLIVDVDRWFDFLEARNLTTHTYNEETAEETYKAAANFYIDAVELFKHLQLAIAKQ